MKSKNTITLLVMICSVLLLIVFQVLWLRGSYERAFYDFRRDANILFRTTVLTMRDSIFAKNIEQVPTDSALRGINTFITLATDSAKSNHAGGISNHIIVRKQSSKIQLFVSRDDSVNADILRPIASQIQRREVIGEDGVAKSFVIRLGPDTLDRHSLHQQVEKILYASGIKSPFYVNVIQHPVDPDEMDFPEIPPSIHWKALPPRPDPQFHVSFFADTLSTDPVKFNPMSAYAASFINIRSALLQKITPQILFSVFLTLMITGAFTLMYRNIRAQQKLMDLKNDFISNVTHELKTPVATVSVAIEALKNFHAMNDQRLTEEYLDIAQRELNRLTFMTDKILKASVFESKGVAFTPEKINFKTLLEQVMESNKAIFENRKANVTVTHEGNNFEVYGSETHLTSVIHNLVDNALKYSLYVPVIDIHLSENDQELVFTIKDNGIGIPLEYQKKIFEKFFRVPTGDVHNIKGYGLGLNHVDSIVKSHNGKIELISEPGRGSTFKIILRKPVSEFKVAVPL